MSRPTASTSAISAPPALPSDMKTSNGCPFSSSVMVTYIVPNGDSTRRVEFWRHIEPRAAVGGYVILITTAPRGTIPAELWRKSHVIYL